MVRIGFVVEGDTEKIVIESAAFCAWAKSQGIEICSPVVNAEGGGNLLPQNIIPIIYTKREHRCFNVKLSTIYFTNKTQ